MSRRTLLYFDPRGARNGFGGLRALGIDAAVARWFFGVLTFVAAACAPESSSRAEQPAASLRPVTKQPLRVAGEMARRIYAAETMSSFQTTSAETLAALRPSREKLERLTRPRHFAWQRRSVASSLAVPANGGRFVMDRGQRLQDALATLPEERRMLGAGAFGPNELFSGPMLCEAPWVDYFFEKTASISRRGTKSKVSLG